VVKKYVFVDQYHRQVNQCNFIIFVHMNVPVGAQRSEEREKEKITTQK